MALPASSSLPQVGIPTGGRVWRRLAAFLGPAYLVAAGYMDPGNWATGIAGGSAFGYTLLSVVLLSSLMAALLQVLSARLGIASGRDLAQMCRDHYGPRAALPLWLLCELAIIACDLAEVIGTAIAIKLLFGLPLIWGIVLTVFNVLLLLALQQRGVRLLEAFIFTLTLGIVGCFVAELIMSRPVLADVAAGLVPDPAILSNPDMLYVAVGIIGATVMPHNLYLHSAIVQTRAFSPSEAGRREAIRFATIDSLAALALAFFVNAGLVVLAASAFHVRGEVQVADLFEAHRLLSPVLGAAAASALFAVALLASGQNSAITATLAGQVVTEGFLDLRLPRALTRFLTRLLAIVPAAAVTVFMGEAATAKLLIFSQVVLSLQLPFAVVPLVRFTGDRTRMGVFANPPWLAWTAMGIAALLVGMNLLLLAGFVLPL